MTSPGDPLAAPGIHVERRALLWLPLAAAGGSLLRGAPICAQDMGLPRAAPGSALGVLSHEEFGKRWVALAEELVPASAEHDESYAAQLAGLIARVPVDALPKLEKPRSAAGVAGGPSWFLAPCVMIEFRMDPKAVLRLHNHPPQIVVTLCAEGEVLYRHLEIEGDAPPCTEIDGAFLARETKSGVLRKGQTTALTRVRDGIHGFAGGERGARIIDFTVSLSESEDFSYIELGEAPLDADRRVYEALWLGRK